MKFQKKNSDTKFTKEIADKLRAAEEYRKKMEEDAVKRIKEEQQKQRPLNNRIKAYPPLQEQLDMLWHDIDSGAIKINKKTTETSWYQTIKDIKRNNPLPKKDGT